MRYIVIKEYTDAPLSPISIKKGEALVLIEESDPTGDWPNWVFCKGEGKEGWIPKQILAVDGSKAITVQDYTAREHNLIKGEVLIQLKELNGWIWGYKENEPDLLGWAPLNHLKKKA